MSGEALPEPRSIRSRIVGLTYEGSESVRDAAMLREQMAATVDLARRARVDAREHLWNAREAERALGRMILSARTAGDLSEHGGSRAPVSKSGTTTLNDLGVSRDLAAHAVALARIPDDVWHHWHEWDTDPTQGAVARSAREYQAQLDAVKAQAAVEREQTRVLQRRKAELERKLAAIAQRAQASTPPDIPPLRDDETSEFGADIVVSAAAPEEPVDRDRVYGDRWLVLMRDIEILLAHIEADPPPLPNDHFADLTVASARDLARRVTVQAAIWIRAVNDEYLERIGR